MGLLWRLLPPLFEPLFKGRRKQGCEKTMARPEGAQALRAIQEVLDEGRSLPGVNYIPLPMIGGRFGEWFEAPSYEEGVGVDGKIRGRPSDGVWGYPPQGNALKKGQGLSPQKRNPLHR